MASPELETVLKQMADRQAAQAADPPADLNAMRTGMEERSFPATEAATIVAVEANGVPGEWITVAESNPVLSDLRARPHNVASRVTRRGDADALSALPIDRDDQAQPPHHTRLSEVQLPGMWATFQRADRHAIQRPPTPERISCCSLCCGACGTSSASETLPSCSSSGATR